MNNMYRLSKLKIYLLLFVTISCDTAYHKHDTEFNGSSMVSIRFDCQYKSDSITHCCSGTILTELYILTAADCVDSLLGNVSAADVTIAADIHSRSKLGQVIRKVDQIITHPSWTNNRGELKHNIALLHLSSPLDFTVNKHITGIFSTTRLRLFEGAIKYPSNYTRLLAIQWNSTTTNLHASTSVNLQHTEVSLVDNNDSICNGLVYDVEQQFCIRFYHDSKGLFCKYVNNIVRSLFL
jgi:secreted trypsin-like serine protease